MPFQPGNPGRPKGTTLKVSQRARDEYFEALELEGNNPGGDLPKSGGRVNVLRRAIRAEGWGPILALYGKTLPRQITGDDYETLALDVDAKVAIREMTPEEAEADYQRLLHNLKVEHS
jgi:hypothetical protein